MDPDESDDIGERLLVLVAEARAAGVDPETALRAAARRYAAAVRAAESTAIRSDAGGSSSEPILE